MAIFDSSQIVIFIADFGVTAAFRYDQSKSPARFEFGSVCSRCDIHISPCFTVIVLGVRFNLKSQPVQLSSV